MVDHVDKLACMRIASYETGFGVFLRFRGDICARNALGGFPLIRRKEEEEGGEE